jgi:RNA-directed DNA polymerase
MEDGKRFETEERTPQGVVISPLPANLYLHYVLDLRVEAWRKKVAHGDVIVVRYADDAVPGWFAVISSTMLSRAMRIE